MGSRWRSSALILIIGLALALATGCAGRSDALANSPPSAAHYAGITLSETPKSGGIASVQKIDTYQATTGTDVTMYKLFYWSNGKKVEAFLTEPTKPGTYPLLVNLHGGAAWHTHGTDNFGYTAKLVAELANAQTVMLYPEYEGYMASQGDVMGLQTDTADVHNAIVAAKLFGETRMHDTYVEGYSLGGGLALMIAAQDPDVRAVVAVSPFVGLVDFANWAQSHAKTNTIFYKQLMAIKASYGDDTSSRTYQDRSPNIANITAPVLLLQGTADRHVAWQTVQTFANQMKADNKVVKLVLYPGGHHGLHTVPYQTQSNAKMNSWFQKYGLNIAQ